jgi:hypothetical protein
MWSFSKKKPFDFKRMSRLLCEYQTALESRWFPRAQKAIDRFFALVEEESPASPDFHLSVKGDEYLQSGDWEGAESAFREILDLPDGNAFVRSKAHLDLFSLFCLLNRDDEALEQAGAATAAAREADSELLLTWSLHGEAACHLKRDELQQAEAPSRKRCLFFPQRNCTITCVRGHESCMRSGHSCPVGSVWPVTIWKPPCLHWNRRPKQSHRSTSPTLWRRSSRTSLTNKG